MKTNSMKTKNHVNASSQEKISEEGKSALTAEQPESLGLLLELDNYMTGKIKVAVSELVALKFGPWVIVPIYFGILICGLWFWGHNIPHSFPPPSPTIELQSQK